MAVHQLLSAFADGSVLMTSENMKQSTEAMARNLQHRGVPIEYSDECVIKIDRFNDTEACADIQMNVRDKAVILCWDFMYGKKFGSISQRFTELLFALSALKTAQVGRVILFLPYLPFSRQDRTMGRQSFTAKMVAEMPEASGVVHGLITFDLHAPQIAGFYNNIHVQNIPAHVIFAPFFRKMFEKEIAAKVLRTLATDVGGSKRTRDFAEHVSPGLDISIIDKRRVKGQAEAMKIVGDVSPCMIAYDDIAGTLDSLIGAGRLAMSEGAQTVVAAIAHNVCCPKNGTTAEAKAKKGGMKIYTLDTLPRGDSYYKRNKEFVRVPYEGFIADVFLQFMTVDGSVKQATKNWLADN